VGAVPAGEVISNPAAKMTLRVVRSAAETNGELLEAEAVAFPALASVARILGRRP
jgi:hypothetical protein